MLIVSPPRAIRIRLYLTAPLASYDRPALRPYPIYGRFPEVPAAWSLAIAASLCLHFGHFRLKAPHNLLTRVPINTIRCGTAGVNVPIYKICALIRTWAITFFFLVSCNKLRRFALNQKQLCGRLFAVCRSVPVSSVSRTVRPHVQP